MTTNRKIKVGIVQHSFTADVESNRARNLTAIESLASEGAQLIVLSELHDSLYFCQTEDVENFALAEEIPSDFTEFYANAAMTNNVVLVTSVFERRAPGLYHNTALVFDIGFNPIQTSLGRLGVLVCWDQWYPEAARLMAMRGAEMLIYPTAIGWNPDDTEDEKARQREAWITVQRGHAVANGLPVVSVNRNGFEEDPSGQTSGIDFWGSSFVAGPQGEILFMAPDNEACEHVVDVDMQRCENVRQWWPFFRDRRIDHYGSLTRRWLTD